MSVDKFGRYSNRARALKGPKGEGFSLTPEGHYDIKGKLLRRVGVPVAESDATTKKYVDSKTPFQNDLVWEFGNKRLSNIADAVEGRDAVNLTCVQNICGTETKKAGAMLASQTVDMLNIKSRLSAIEGKVARMVVNQERQLRKFGALLFDRLQRSSEQPQGRSDAVDVNNFIDWNEVFREPQRNTILLQPTVHHSSDTV